MRQRNGISLGVYIQYLLLYGICAVQCCCPGCCYYCLASATKYQIVYVSECWGEIVSKRKYVNETDSWSRIVWGILCHFWKRECVCVRVVVNLWFSDCLSNWPFLNGSYFMVVSSKGRKKKLFGLEFDQGLFMAVLLVKINSVQCCCFL